MQTLLPALRATLFYAGYAGSLILYATPSLLIAWMLPLRARYRLFLRWNTFALWWLQLTCGINYRIIGIENIPKEPFVLLSNHQSPWETLFLYDQFQPLCATLKRELLFIPLFGWALYLLHPIAIDRSKRASARQTLLREGRKRLADGISVLVFPEGTRVAIGQEKRFSTGGTELAITTGVPILPVAHNAGKFWPSRRYLKFPGTVDVVIGAPITTSGKEVRELTDSVQNWIRQVRPN